MIIQLKAVIKVSENSFYIRHMKYEDVLKVYDIERKCFPYPFGEVLINNIYLAAPELCFVAEYNQEIIGFLLGGYTSVENQTHILSIGYRTSEASSCETSIFLEC